MKFDVSFQFELNRWVFGHPDFFPILPIRMNKKHCHQRNSQIGVGAYGLVNGEWPFWMFVTLAEIVYEMQPFVFHANAKTDVKLYNTSQLPFNHLFQPFTSIYFGRCSFISPFEPLPKTKTFNKMKIGFSGQFHSFVFLSFVLILCSIYN